MKMKQFFKKINPLNQYTTYNTGLLQAKAYRYLKQYISDVLRKYDLSSLEWAMLGQLFDNEKMRAVDIAKRLGVEAPLVTNLVDTLEKKQLATRVSDSADRRAKHITLSDKGKALVPVIESHMKQKMKELLKGLRTSEILTYIKVLEQIASQLED